MPLIGPNATTLDRTIIARDRGLSDTKKYSETRNLDKDLFEIIQKIRKEEESSQK